MPPRAMWTGQMRISLVSFGVRLFAATESGRTVSMNQLHKDCHQRLKQQMMCPVHGAVTRDEIVKGYEYEKDKYVIMAQEDLDGIRLESTKTIDLVRFVDAGAVDPVYVDSPYYLGPDGPVAAEAFGVIREAMSRAGKAGIGKLVMHGRERVLMVRVKGRGFEVATLRYAAEVRSADDVFEEVKLGPVDEEQLALASSIIQSKSGAFEPAAFEDKYSDAFFEIVKRKVEGRQAEPEGDDVSAPAPINFMEALKASVAAVEQSQGGEASPARAASRSKEATGARAKSAKKPASGAKPAESRPKRSAKGA